EVQKIGDRTRTGSIEEHTPTTADDQFAFLPRRPGEAQARREIICIIVKVVLEVVAQACGKLKSGFHADIVLDKSSNILFQEHQMPLPALDKVVGRTRCRIVSKARETVSPKSVREVVCASAAPVGYLNTELEIVLAAIIRDDVRALGVRLSPFFVGL